MVILNMVEEEKIGTLLEEALKRKERVASQSSKKKNDTLQDKNNTDKLPAPKFRSYKPQDETLRANSVGDAKPGDVESEIQDQLQAAAVKPVIEELDITNLAPRKPDWDLKRNAEKKLQKLQRRTQKSIAELILERMKSEKNLAKAVHVGDEYSKDK